MVELENSEQTKRCFIVGTGSSINNQDLSFLKDEIVIGVSGLYMHKDIQIINPKYYVLPPVFEYHKQYVNESSYVNWLNEIENALNEKTIYFFSDLDKSYLKKYNLFQDKNIIYQTYVPYTESDTIEEIKLTKFPTIWSVSESAIQMALYLGFEEIFLIGFDHDWFNGIFVHFNGSEYLKHINNSKNNMRDIHGIDSEMQMRRHAFIFNKYKKLYKLKQNIYNANANENTYVDTFPKVNYEKLFTKDYKNHLTLAKENFMQVSSTVSIKNSNLEFSKKFSNLNLQILNLNPDKKYVIYGNGTVGKFMFSLIADKIVAFVDQASELVSNEIINTSVYNPLNLKNMKYDYIIVSVLGRESEVKAYLHNQLNIELNKILEIDL